MTRKRRRLWLVGVCLVAFGSATALTLSAFSGDIVYFMLPGAVLAKHPAPGRVFRLGGLVAQNTLHDRTIDGQPGVVFGVTDGAGHIVLAEFAGPLPDLFREGQGIVAVGAMTPDGTFRASEVLAKHSASYMPPDVEAALKKDGLWNPATGQPPPAAAFNGSLERTAATKAAGG
ncbi:cytochrome c maturation protein CcmE [Acidisoma cellulosilytica]|uniref:Cytochrome c-type biogenesis protein CcmE n=1 Tax=Acidisoma cellulosilyticum TaxID=2802395 RepID=A0A964E209_9PROT|nr:cytochrome c maturation protein CcmE [Acidisoma cellulosilyticum]MCB8879105.1 cytochrome c maturation protein CcmE [Acidisoma cellulosilyticum]